MNVNHVPGVSLEGMFPIDKTIPFCGKPSPSSRFAMTTLTPGSPCGSVRQISREYLSAASRLSQIRSETDAGGLGAGVPWWKDDEKRFQRILIDEINTGFSKVWMSIPNRP